MMPMRQALPNFGGSFGEQYVAYLSLNNSVGGSIIIRENIYQGQNQRGGEFGHMTIVPDGALATADKKAVLTPIALPEYFPTAQAEIFQNFSGN